MGTSAFQDNKQVFNSTMKNVPLPVASERDRSGIFNILHELLQYSQTIINYKPSYILLSRAIKLRAQRIELNWFSRQFGSFFPLLTAVVSKGNSLDGTPELVTQNKQRVHNAPRLWMPETVPEWHSAGLVTFQALIENLCYLLVFLQHFSWDCYALLLPFLFKYDFFVSFLALL